MAKKPVTTKRNFERFLVYERQLRGFFRRRLKRISDAEDLTQEVFLRAFKAAQEQEIKDPRAFLFAIARNVMLNDMTKRSRSVVDSIEDLSPSIVFKTEISTERDVSGRDEWRRFAEATAKLPAQCRKVFILKKIYGFSNKEVAAKLKISTSTVEKHIALGLRRIRELMSADAKTGESGQLDNITTVTKYRR